MLNNTNKKFLLLIIFIFTTVDLAYASVIISQTDGSASAWFGQSEGYINVGQGQSFYVNQEGWISEIQIYLKPSNGMPVSTDQIICDLRDLDDGEILQSSSIKGFTDEGWKSFSFDKNVIPGNYVFTCYFSRSYTLRDENYGIHGNSNNNSYLEGTRYTSTGGHPEDWSTWKPSVWDLKFKVMILTEIERNTPKTPSQPSGPASGYTGTSYTYSTSATDINNDQIQYIFDWGDGTQDPTYFVNSGSGASASYSWTDPGNYIIKARAIDSGNLESGWSDEVTITITNPPPGTPRRPSGPASGHTEIFYTYSTSATDPNDDQIKYTFDWGDGTQSSTDFVNSGSEASASHNWTDPGNYTIKARAMDSGYFESELSDGLTITITPPEEEDEETLIPVIGVILVFSGLLLTALTTIKKDITIEFGVSQRSIKYVGGAGMLLIIIGVFMLLRHAGLI